MALTSLFDVYDDETISETINQLMTLTVPAADPLFNVIATSENVNMNDVTRNWQVIKTVQGSYTGVVQAEGGSGAIMLGDNVQETGNRLYFQNQGNTEVVDPTLGANPNHDQLRVGLLGFEASIAVTLQQMRTEIHPDQAASIMGPILQGFVNNLVQTRAVQFYADTENGKIGEIGTITESAEAGDSNSATDYSYIKFTVPNNVISRFKTGMIVDLYSGSTKQSPASGAIVVGPVDYYRDTVTLIAQDDTFFDDSSQTVWEGWDIYIRNGYGNSLNGINSVLKNSGNYFNLPLSDWPEFGSFVKDNGGSVLTAQSLRNWLHRFRIANQPHGHDIDTLMVSEGVFNAYQNNTVGLVEINKPASGAVLGFANEGYDPAFVFHYNGKAYTFRFSDYIKDGDMYGTKLGGGNWKRYVPPRTPGVSDFDSGIPSFLEFEFWGPKMGLPSIWDNLRGANNRATKMKYAFGDCRMEILPDMPAGIKVTNLGSDTVVSD